MQIELIELLMGIVVILILATLFVLFDTIKRIKGTFNRGWKVLFFAFSLFVVIQFVAILVHLGLLRGGLLLREILKVVTFIAILVSVIIINKKVKEVHDGQKKIKYRAKKK